MPSEIADGRDSGAGASEVKVYKLSDEELAKYRGLGGDDVAGKRKMAGKMDELHARFAAGHGSTWASINNMAKEYGVSPGTIYYYRRQWLDEQKEAAKVESVTEDTATEAPESAPASSQEPGNSTEVHRPMANPERPSDEPTDVPAGHEVSTEQEQVVQSDQVADEQHHGLCCTCVKRDVCLVADMSAPPMVMPTDHLPEKLRSMRIVLNPRFVLECSAYHAG